MLSYPIFHFVLMLQENDSVPSNGEVTDNQGNKVVTADLLSLHKGLTVLYFYPRDETTGCTLEACEFRDFNDEIQKLGVKVIGISKDSPKSHVKFKQKHKLNFEIYSDEEHKLQDAFGVWVEKSMYGRKYMGTKRTTFVIDKAGKIVKVWDNVRPLGHAKEVYDYLKTIV